VDRRLPSIASSYAGLTRVSIKLQKKISEVDGQWTVQAASSRLISVSNAKRSCAPSSSGSQFVICGKMVR
jgi:hypothetical protein